MLKIRSIAKNGVCGQYSAAALRRFSRYAEGGASRGDAKPDKSSDGLHRMLNERSDRGASRYQRDDKGYSRNGQGFRPRSDFQPRARDNYGGRSDYSPRTRDNNGGSSYSRDNSVRSSNYSRDNSGGRSDMSAGGSNYDNSDLGARLVKVDFSEKKLAPIVTNLFKEAESVKARTAADTQEFCKKHQITIVADEIPKHIESFEEAMMPGKMSQLVKRLGFDVPSPIQSIVWPIAMSGVNLVGISHTGSGKTLAFTLPAIIHAGAQSKNYSRHDGPAILVLAPTRELAFQIDEEFNKFSTLKTVCLFGGASKSNQMRSINNGVDVIIATPGRLIDLLEEGNFTLTRVSYVVMDEADRMLDMGFEPQLRKIMDQIRPDRQVCCFSATWPREVQSLARDYLDKFVQINVGSGELEANKNITQTVEIVPHDRAKKDAFSAKLKEILKKDPAAKVLVFTATKLTADDVSNAIYDDGIRADALHGDKKQNARDRILLNFRSGRTKVMVATDVAARGLDVKDVGYVINYDMPHSIEDYIHRIGRTGRAGSTGESHSFITPGETNIAGGLVRILNRVGQPVPKELADLCPPPSSSKRGGSNYGRGGGYNQRGGGSYNRGGGSQRSGGGGYNQRGSRSSRN